MTPQQYKLLELIRNNGGWNSMAVLPALFGGSPTKTLKACLSRGWLIEEDFIGQNWRTGDEIINSAVRLTPEGEAALLREQQKDLEPGNN